jgi:hypothetical protein
MAKKKQSGQVLALIDAPEGAVDDGEEVNPDELRALAELDSGNEAKWVVTRLSDIGAKKAGYCGELSTGELSNAKVAEEWGVGKYRVKGTRQNGTIAGQRTITIAEAPKGQAVTQTLMPQGSGTAELLALLDAREEKSSEKMLKWAAILSPILAPALANLFGGQKGPSLTDLTTAMANIKALEGGTKVDQMTEFTKLLELVDRVKGDEPKPAGSNWVDLVRDGLGQLPLMAQTFIAARTGQPLPQLSKQDESAPAAPDTNGEPMLAWLKRQLEALTHQASMNKDPGLYAEVMLDNLPAGTNPQLLLDQLAADDWWQRLAAFSPGVQPYPQWFAECRVELLSGLTAMLAPVAAPPAAAAVIVGPNRKVAKKKT